MQANQHGKNVESIKIQFILKTCLYKSYFQTFNLSFNLIVSPIQIQLASKINLPSSETREVVSLVDLI